MYVCRSRPKRWNKAQHSFVSSNIRMAFTYPISNEQQKQFKALRVCNKHSMKILGNFSRKNDYCRYFLLPNNPFLSLFLYRDIFLFMYVSSNDIFVPFHPPSAFSTRPRARNDSPVRSALVMRAVRKHPVVTKKSRATKIELSFFGPDYTLRNTAYLQYIDYMALVLP
jgi:hypothetical protein